MRIGRQRLCLVPLNQVILLCVTAGIEARPITCVRGQLRQLRREKKEGVVPVIMIDRSRLSSPRSSVAACVLVVARLTLITLKLCSVSGTQGESCCPLCCKEGPISSDKKVAGGSRMLRKEDLNIVRFLIFPTGSRVDAVYFTK